MKVFQNNFLGVKISKFIKIFNAFCCWSFTYNNRT